MSVNKYLTISILVISLFVFLNLASRVNATEYCTLDIYVKYQDSNPIDGNIYVDGSFKGHDNHITVDVEVGTHEVEVTKSRYHSDTQTFTCSCSETKRVDLTLTRIEEEVEISTGSLELDPSSVCLNEDETVKASIQLTQEHGDDNTFISAKFYLEDWDGDWNYIGKDEGRLDGDKTRTFSQEFNPNDYSLNDRTYDVKVIIESDDFERTEFSQLDINDCGHGINMVDVGSIDVDNEYPNKGDIVKVSVPITLDFIHPSQTVYLNSYVDDSLFNSVNMWFSASGTKTYQFTIDTDKYSTGPHTIKVKAEVKGKTDTYTRTFSISPVGYYSKTEHCFSIEKIWSDEELKVGERNKVNVRVVSCGKKYENNVKMKLEAFSNTFYSTEFDVPFGGSKDVSAIVTIPEDASEKQTFKVTVWNDYTSDTWSKDFVVYTAIPFIKIKPEFEIEDCQTKTIRFDVINNGKVADTFTLTLTGMGSEWVTDVPETVTLNPGDTKIVYADMSIPCDTEPGFYKFTITAKGSPEYSVTSTIHVIKSFGWPTFPTGLFISGFIFWLPWVLLILLILFLLFLFLFCGLLTNGRRRPMFDCPLGSCHC